MGVVLQIEEMKRTRSRLRDDGRILVFTNGVFDLLHRGHCEYLAEARNRGDALVVGVNTDASVRRLKGEQRPLVPEEDRAYVLSMLSMVDFVVLFDEDTPQRLIAELLPDVLIKGGDYALHEIVGRKEVENAGGAVLTIPLTPGKSSTNIVQTIIDRFCDKAD